MPRNLTCPVCGNRGQATTDDTGAFEVRGWFKDKEIRKCKKCESGLAVAPFFCGLFRKTEVIPASVWQQMGKAMKQQVVAPFVVHQLPRKPDSEALDRAWEEHFQPLALPHNAVERVRTELLCLLAYANDFAICRKLPYHDQAVPLLDSFYWSYQDLGIPFEELMERRRAYAEAATTPNASPGDSVGEVFGRLCDIVRPEVERAAREAFCSAVAVTEHVLQEVHAKYRIIPEHPVDWQLSPSRPM